MSRTESFSVTPLKITPLVASSTLVKPSADGKPVKEQSYVTQQGAATRDAGDKVFGSLQKIRDKKPEKAEKREPHPVLEHTQKAVDAAKKSSLQRVKQAADTAAAPKPPAAPAAPTPVATPSAPANPVSTVKAPTRMTGQQAADTWTRLSAGNKGLQANAGEMRNYMNRLVNSGELNGLSDRQITSKLWEMQRKDLQANKPSDDFSVTGVLRNADMDDWNGLKHDFANGGHLQADETKGNALSRLGKGLYNSALRGVTGIGANIMDATEHDTQALDAIQRGDYAGAAGEALRGVGSVGQAAGRVAGALTAGTGLRNVVTGVGKDLATKGVLRSVGSGAFNAMETQFAAEGMNGLIGGTSRAVDNVGDMLTGVNDTDPNRLHAGWKDVGLNLIDAGVSGARWAGSKVPGDLTRRLTQRGMPTLMGAAGKAGDILNKIQMVGLLGSGVGAVTSLATDGVYGKTLQDYGAKLTRLPDMASDAVDERSLGRDVINHEADKLKTGTPEERQQRIDTLHEQLEASGALDSPQGQRIKAALDAARNEAASGGDGSALQFLMALLAMLFGGKLFGGGTPNPTTSPVQAYGTSLSRLQ